MIIAEYFVLGFCMGFVISVGVGMTIIKKMEAEGKKIEDNYWD